MTPIMQSEIFFFISSVGFIVFAIMGIALLAICIQAVASFKRILAKIESSMDSIGDATMDLLDDLRGNVVFRILFGQRKKRHINNPK